MMPDKLDSKIKDSLRDSETPFDPSGWDRIERNLDAQVSTPQFKFKMNWKYSLNTVLVVVAGSALIAGAIKLTDYLSQVPEQVSSAPQPVVITPKKNVSTPIVKSTTSEPQKEVVVQQFFPTQVYNIQYPLYNGMKYNGPPNDQVATENYNSEGEFSELVKNRPILTNPLVRGYLLGNESPVNSQQPVVLKQGGSELKLTPEELRLFSDPSLLNSRKGLIFPDQIDSKKGYVLPSKEADSMKKIQYFQEKPEITTELINDLKKEEDMDKKTSDTDTKTDAPKPPKNNKKEKNKKIENTDTKNSSDQDPTVSPEKKNGEKGTIENKKKRSDKPKEGGSKKDPLDPYQN